MCGMIGPVHVSRHVTGNVIRSRAMQLRVNANIWRLGMMQCSRFALKGVVIEAKRLALHVLTMSPGKKLRDHVEG